MRTFTIENEDNNIILHASASEAEAIPDAQRFATQEQLCGLADHWPTSRLTEIWNSLPGATPVRKFQTRAIAAARIWKAIQHLGDALPPEQPADEAVVETALDAQVAAEPVPGPGAGIVAPRVPEAAPVESPAISAATAANDAPNAAPAEKLVRILERAFEGLTPEQHREKWNALKKALDELKPADAQKAAKTGAPREGSKTSQVIAMLKREGGTTVEQIMVTMEWQQHTTRAMLSAGGSLVKSHGLVIVSENVGGKRVYSIKA
jgi:hypothetical protein